MSLIRFSCHHCGQHLSCEPDIQGMKIDCPACKQPLLIVTLAICASYRMLELDPGAPLNDVKEAHRERIKLWDRDRFPEDTQFQERATEKARELNDALRVVTAYLSGRILEPQSRPEAGEQPAKPQVPAAPKQRPSAEPRVPAKTPQTSANRASTAAFNQEQSVRGRRILVAAGVSIAIILLIGLAAFAVSFLQGRGPVLTSDNTVAQWVAAKERVRRAYCRAVMVELEQQGTLQKYRARVNEDSFYEGLESVSRQKNPEDLNAKLLDICTRVVKQSATVKISGDPN